ncbi:hypothetical protein CK203_080111 [Vitis vinifera]|uniref:Uncharacterized protein n=1 Tax=Vitis vinifera TaxID=29760 RepID=A0A438D9R9_VITVI|nr:hypothetical protein CK203_080111 [Vitis vinifera]
MSAAVCGSKRSFMDDIETTPPQASKKLRCSSNSPPRCSPPSAPLRQLAATFPLLDFQEDTAFKQVDLVNSPLPLISLFRIGGRSFLVLERALAECDNDLDSAMKSLHEHHSRYMEKRIGSVEGTFAANMDKGSITADGTAFSNNLPVDGGEWVELFVREMMNAANVDDARARATRALNGLEKSISARSDAEVAQTFYKMLQCLITNCPSGALSSYTFYFQENIMLKEQLEVLMRENTILKRGVAIQHERQREYDDRNRELQMLKHLVPQYQEQLRTLEVKNYTLSMHLRHMQQSSSVTGRFNPDIF